MAAASAAADFSCAFELSGALQPTGHPATRRRTRTRTVEAGLFMVTSNLLAGIVRVILYEERDRHKASIDFRARALLFLDHKTQEGASDLGMPALSP